LGYYDIGILGYWGIMILGYWDIGILGYWDIGILLGIYHFTEGVSQYHNIPIS
jgi:hypothetical protein